MDSGEIKQPRIGLGGLDPPRKRALLGRPLADLGFFRGGDFGNSSERSERALRGSGLTGAVASPGFGSRMGTKRHRNNLSHTHNNNMK